MTLSRRRFLTISAACAVAGPARAARWQGRALGAQVEITLRGPSEVTQPALAQARALLRRVERQFDLHDSRSALSALNRDGRLAAPDTMFAALMDAAERVHAATGGLFDPTVQPLWRALAAGEEPSAARALVDWHRVRRDAGGIVLGRGQSLTFNGIAQGFATDLVAEALNGAGLHDTLVNIGEFRGSGGPWHLGLSDPVHGLLGMRTLTTGAIATSSPAATPLGQGGHILHGHARPLWSTVSVEAADATTADGFSTALVLAPLARIRSLVGQHGIRRVTLVDAGGDLMTLAS